MFSNYLKTALRNFVRNKSFTLINVLGLTMGIASCLLIFFVIHFELSFDQYQGKKDRIYRVVSQFSRGGNLDYSNGVSIPVPDALRTAFPQCETVAAIAKSDAKQITVLNGEGLTKKMNEQNIFYAQPQLFDILDTKWLAGNPKTSLTGPGKVVLSRKTADKYFGNWKQALGKLIRHQNSETLTVTGILDDLPVNTDFPLDLVISYQTATDFTRDNDWGSTSSDFNCLVVLAPGVSPEQVSALLPAFRSRHVKEEGGDAKTAFLLQPLKEIHFDERYGNYNARTFSRELILALSLIGAFLLIIACVNFINLSTAQAVIRAREVGVRKVLGVSRGQLVFQYLGETFLITLFSVILACLIGWFTLPFLGKMLQIPLGQGLPEPAVVILFLACITIAVTFCSGFYPALILSGFNPAHALKSKLNRRSTGGISLRRVLVVLQFTIAQVLIIGTLVVLNQMNFFQQAPMGFEKNAIVNIPLPEDSTSHSKIRQLRQNLLNLQGVQQVSFSFAPPANEGNWRSEFTFDHAPRPADLEPTLKWADADYGKTYHLQLVAGRFYLPSDTVTEFVVNETLVKKLGLNNPQAILGKEISFWNRRVVARVVGVIRDFHANSLRDPIDPVIMASWVKRYQTIGIRIETAKTAPVLAAVEKLWNQTFPDYVYEYKFLDDRIAAFYTQENELSQLYRVFALIAIFISCLGLYGLVSFLAVQRIKEVGVRKVLGASAWSIVSLFSKEFTLLICIAFLIASPLAYFFMRQWLNNFSYRIDLGIQFFFLAFAGSIGIAWLTVGYKAVKAAMANPVKSLRTE